MNRREALGAVAGMGVVAMAQTESNGMIYRELGKTGERVSAIGLGGYHVGLPESADEGIRIVRTAVDNGITFLDNCWDYNGGESERRMGKALRDGYRQKVFLMTKFDGRTKWSACIRPCRWRVIFGPCRRTKLPNCWPKQKSRR